MQDLERVRYVAGNYGRLQGLRKVPSGVVLLLMVTSIPIVGELLRGATLETVGFVISGFILAVVPILLGLSFCDYALSRYYEREFGISRRLPSIPGRRKLFYAVVGLVLLGLGGPGGALLLGAAMLVAYWPERRLQSHYLVIAVLIIGTTLTVAALTALGVISASTMGYTAWFMVPAAFALFFLVGGVCDHLLLVRTFRVIPEESNGATG